MALHFFADIKLTASLAVAWFVRYKAADGQRTKLALPTKRACKVFFFFFDFGPLAVMRRSPCSLIDERNDRPSETNALRYEQNKN